MKNLLLCIISILFVSQSAMAAYEGWGSKGSSSESVRGSAGAPMFHLLPAGGVAVGAGRAAPGVLLQFGARVVRRLPLHITLDSGAFFYGGGYYAGYAYGGHVIVPILFGMDYEFHLPASPVSFVAGINMGPVVGYDVSFGLEFRPGVNVNLDRGLDFSFEPRFGVYASTFLFLPQLGLRVGL